MVGMSERSNGDISGFDALSRRKALVQQRENCREFVSEKDGFRRMSTIVPAKN
jgi:hypothetical protein